MSRLNRYVDSLHKFIKDRSCLLDKESLPTPEIGEIIYNKVKKSGLIIPILLLTVMNSQNKKNSVSVTGYYAASTIQFLHTIIEITEDKQNIIETYGEDTYHNIINYLTLSSSRSLCQNLETVKNSINDGDTSSKIFINSMKVFNANMNYSKILNSKTVKNLPTDSDDLLDTSNNDVSKWYIKDDKSLNDKFKNLKKITRESFDEYTNNKLGSLCEIAVCIGWVIGCGNEKKINRIKKIAKYFANFYKISEDLQNIEHDIRESIKPESKNISYNFVLNYGLQNAYEFFMDNKRRFIEEAMKLDIYSSTIKEIINFIEAKVDNVIDDTSPDIKSSYSSKPGK